MTRSTVAGGIEYVDFSLDLARLFAESPSLRERVAVTCFGKNDGGGAQCFAVLSAILFASDHRIRYFHRPFSSVGHVVGSMESWAKQWEDLLRLGEPYTRCHDADPVVPVHSFLQEPGKYPGPVTLVARHFHAYANSDPDRYHRVIGPIRTAYMDRRDANAAAEAVGTLRVAVHVRRGDILNKPHRMKQRFTSDSAILTTIDGVRHELAGHCARFVISIYSEGEPEDFSAFAREGCTLHLSRSVFDDFDDMVHADVLVTAKSSLSCLAALLSRGIIVYQRYFNHPRLTHWIPRRREGTFDGSLMRRSLAALPAPPFRESVISDTR